MYRGIYKGYMGIFFQVMENQMEQSFLQIHGNRAHDPSALSPEP